MNFLKKAIIASLLTCLAFLALRAYFFNSVEKSEPEDKKEEDNRSLDIEKKEEEDPIIREFYSSTACKKPTNNSLLAPPGLQDLFNKSKPTTKPLVTINPYSDAFERLLNPDPVDEKKLKESIRYVKDLFRESTSTENLGR